MSPEEVDIALSEGFCQRLLDRGEWKPMKLSKPATWFSMPGRGDA